MNKIIHQWANFERRSDIPTQCPHAAVFASAWLFCLFLTFGITPLKAQSFNVLHGFTNSPDGANPVAGLTLDGNMLFGTAQHGGTNDNGLVFAIANDGSGYTVLHYFTNNPDGAIPHGGLALDGDTLYGTTTTGGTNPPDGGIVFSINTNGGDYTVLH
ncbi:MAG: choice-of-anchor tandem repeat GloVer-containing protein, partial [Limisphaerales bacterium]